MRDARTVKHGAEFKNDVLNTHNGGKTKGNKKHIHLMRMWG